jgi:uncharacterized membrane protein YfcA
MTYLLIALAGLAAGFINVLAGGGSFLTLPAMIGAGLTALAANASSTVALFPSQALTALFSRSALTLDDPESGGLGISLKVLSAISLAGGLAGAVLLLVTPPSVFLKIVPWLILFATLVFAGGSFVGRKAAKFRFGARTIYAMQVVVAVYGGYFGGGIGIMMLAALTVFGLRDIRVMNSIKILLATLMNVAAVGAFLLAGIVQWPQTLLLGAMALIGSFVGIYAARRVPALYVRVFVIVIGLCLTAGFFLKAG